MKRFIPDIDYELILFKILQITIIIIASIIIYYIVLFIIKRIFSVSFKKIHLKNPYLLQRRKKSLEKITLSLLRYAFYFITFLIILSTLGINVQTILAGAGILGLVFAVGSQNLMKDFVEGFFNVFEDNISIGDYVEIDDASGNIIDIGLRTLKIKSFTGEIHIIPNSKIGHVKNYSLEDGKALVDVLIAYDVDLDKVLEVINATLNKIKDKNINILSDPQILGVNNLHPLGYEIRIMCLTIKETHWAVQRFIRAELLKAFKEKQIAIGKNQILIEEKRFLD